MSTTKRLALLAAGYVLAVCGGLAAVSINELRMPEDIAQGSPGMVAFGDMILFFFATGFLGLVPTWFLLKLCIEKIPRTLLAAELVAAAMGPVSWLLVRSMAGGPPSNVPQAIGPMLGLFIAFIAIPRMVLGPVVMVIEAVTFVLMRGRVVRVLLAAAILMDLVPLTLFALHMARATRY